jgi:hypothetical protein
MPPTPLPHTGRQTARNHIRTQARRVTVVPYADDVTVFVTRPADFTTILTAIQLFERATGASLNPKKSKAVAIGRWTAPSRVLGIEFFTHVKIRGVAFGPTIENSTKESWAGVIRAVRAQSSYARETYVSHRGCNTCIYA